MHRPPLPPPKASQKRILWGTALQSCQADCQGMAGEASLGCLNMWARQEVKILSDPAKWEGWLARHSFLELMGSLLMSPAYSKAATRARGTKAVPADSVAWATVGMSLSPGTSFCSIHFPHLLKNTWSVSFCFENKHPLGFHTLKANPFSLYWCSYLSPLPSPSEEIFFFYSFGIWLTIHFSMLVESWEKVEKDLF